MTGFLAIYRKELTGYCYSLLSYIFMVVFLVILGWLFWQNVFLVGQTTMRDWFSLLPWFFLFLVPALAMRLWSEDKKQGTIETLLTLPVSDSQVILAKFLAADTFLAIVLVFSLPIPITLARLGELDWGPVVGAYLGAWLLGGTYLALGQWLSSLTKNQIVAFLVTVAMAFGLVLLGLPGVTSGSGTIAAVIASLSPLTHFTNLAKGVISARDLVYYLSAIGLFLYCNKYVLNRRHYS
ncbi:MAG: ABC transporter permease subunit [Candidatus Kerfeldbacteria bacterium]|nr:ABC transporter permease subunit [Candidatus Kerfeldbacteria bacterium]